MLGIGLFPFVLLPWVLFGPVLWGSLAHHLWLKHRKLAHACAAISTLSLLIPLMAWLWEGFGAAGGAGLLIAVPSFVIFLVVIIILLYVRIQSALQKKPK